MMKNIIMILDNAVPAMKRIIILLSCIVWGSGLFSQYLKLENEKYLVALDDSGMIELKCLLDTFQANFVRDGSRFGEPYVQFSIEGADWQVLSGTTCEMHSDSSDQSVVYTRTMTGTPMALTQVFQLRENYLDYTLDLETTGDSGITIGDLAIPVPWGFRRSNQQIDIFEKGFTKHHYISGDGSFLYFSRPSGRPPYLLVTTRQGTGLEYFSSGWRTGYKIYIHSYRSGHEETRGTWRQKHTKLELEGRGGVNSSVSYGLRFHWVFSHDEMRDVLYREGLFDTRVVPGMTLPSDLQASISLHTLNRIDSIVPEFPDQTKLIYLGELKPDHHVYKVSFKRLGENMLTVYYNGNEKVYLEFFSTEPLEILFKKRADFITRRQQHRDTSRWYNGLFSVYDMKNSVLRGPDDTDGFDGWWGYVLACDDPALCKAPYVAAKNVFYPVPEEIESVEYYLKHFVWGGLQRTDKESPYPYGIHGVPNWKVSRDSAARAKIETRNLDKLKIWRSYDYPHMVMLYYHMYQIASFYPDLVNYLDAKGYLERAYQTALAYWRYPYEVLPWYETYKIGCYNELVILDLISTLEMEGFPERARKLRHEWEIKAKYFIYDDPYPYGSEYSLDRTAFESSYALARYAVMNEMKADSNLWYDKNLKKWYSHPVVSREKAREFMDRQHDAGLTVRGWLETKYYLLGTDFTMSSDRHCMSYMACMGGWSILDYGIYFSERPWDWLQLGYASYLSSWSLMNTGTEESNYGYWFPGKQNDGATGWAFMSSKFGRAWIRKDVPRGAWHYDGEIDLGYGAATRTAICLLAEDPLFGWMVYGGTLSTDDDAFSIIPGDGLRVRFGIVTNDKRFVMELDRDGFSGEEGIRVTKMIDRITCRLENRASGPHETRLSMYMKEPVKIIMDGEALPIITGENSWEVSLPVHDTSHKIEIIL